MLINKTGKKIGVTKAGNQLFDTYHNHKVSLMDYTNKQDITVTN